MVHPTQRRTVQQGRLSDVSTYELMFELVARIRETNGMQMTGIAQLRIVGNACINELAHRHKKEYDER